jgi:hypothetical protein
LNSDYSDRLLDEAMLTKDDAKRALGTELRSRKLAVEETFSVRRCANGKYSNLIANGSQTS